MWMNPSFHIRTKICVVTLDTGLEAETKKPFIAICINISEKFSVLISDQSCLSEEGNERILKVLKLLQFSYGFVRKVTKRPRKRSGKLVGKDLKSARKFQKKYVSEKSQSGKSEKLIKDWVHF